MALGEEDSPSLPPKVLWPQRRGGSSLEWGGRSPAPAMGLEPSGEYNPDVPAFIQLCVSRTPLAGLGLKGIFSPPPYISSADLEGYCCTKAFISLAQDASRWHQHQGCPSGTWRRHMSMRWLVPDEQRAVHAPPAADNARNSLRAAAPPRQQIPSSGTQGCLGVAGREAAGPLQLQPCHPPQGSFGTTLLAEHLLCGLPCLF